MAKKTISMRKNSQGDSAAVLEEELQKVEPTEEYSVSDDASDNLDFFENDMKTKSFLKMSMRPKKATFQRTINHKKKRRKSLPQRNPSPDSLAMP